MIEFLIILNLGFSDLKKVICIFRRLHIFSLYCFDFVYISAFGETLLTLMSFYPCFISHKWWRWNDTNSANIVFPNVYPIFSQSQRYIIFFFARLGWLSCSRCVWSFSARTRDEDKCSSLKISLFESSNKSLEDVKKLRLFLDW